MPRSLEAGERILALVADRSSTDVEVDLIDRAALPLAGESGTIGEPLGRTGGAADADGGEDDHAAGDGEVDETDRRS